MGPLTLEQFARDNSLSLTRFAYVLCGNRARAEDLVQDTLLAMWRRFGAELPVEDPMAYARRAVVNANISWSRRRWSQDLLVDEPPTQGHTDRYSVEDEPLWSALSALPPRQRAVLVLRYYSGHSDPEIAEILGVRRGTVRSLAARGLEALRSATTFTDFAGGHDRPFGPTDGSPS